MRDATYCVPTRLSILLQFQSTHPMRDATKPKSSHRQEWQYFNPRIPCGMRLSCSKQLIFQTDFNPRIPCGMRPVCRCLRWRCLMHFNPRIPCGMRHTQARTSRTNQTISIHASHAGCDHLPPIVPRFFVYFNPRIPCGMRHCKICGCAKQANFNPRIPCGMRLKVLGDCKAFREFQSTHPMRDATLSLFTLETLQALFQSTHPMRDATRHGFYLRRYRGFQSTHPMRDATSRSSGIARPSGNFNPRIPCGMRLL